MKQIVWSLAALACLGIASMLASPAEAGHGHGHFHSHYPHAHGHHHHHGHVHVGRYGGYGGYYPSYRSNYAPYCYPGARSSFYYQRPGFGIYFGY